MAWAIFSRGERIKPIMSRVTAQAQIVQLRADIFRVGRRPFEIRRIELNNLVPDLRHGFQGSWQVARQFASDGVKLQADRVLLCLSSLCCRRSGSRAADQPWRGECSGDK